MIFSKVQPKPTYRNNQNMMMFQKSESDIKRTNKSNITHNTNNIFTNKIHTDSVQFDVKNQKYINVNIPKETKERYVKKVSKQKFVAPNENSVYPPNSMTLPFKNLQTKYTEVVFDSNPRDPNKTYIVFPTEKVEPLLEKILKNKSYVKQNVEQYLKGNKLTMDDLTNTMNISIKERIQEYMNSLEKQGQTQKKELMDFIQSFVKEKIELFSRTDLLTIVSEKIPKNEALPRQEMMELIQTELTQYMSEYQVKQMILEKSEELMKSFDTKLASTKPEIIELIESKEFVTRTDAENIVNEKIHALNMEYLVEDYVSKMATKGEDCDNYNDDEAKTKFEEIIEPSVARIIHRVMKYDQAHEIPDGNSIHSDIDYKDVYDYEAQETSQFQNPDEKNNTYNPMYTMNEPIYSDSPIVEMGKVYQDKDIVHYENELRALGSRRWNRFGNGIEKGTVIDIFLDKKNRKIYIAGNFKFVNRVPVENIAVYDLNAKTWKHIGEGIPQVATSIAVDEDKEIVYVGGVFSKVGKGENAINANNIAAYNISENKWYSLGDGLNRDCTSIVIDKTNKLLYAGGSFTHSGSNVMKHVAVYDTEKNEWSALKGGSLNGPCRVLLKPTEDELYLGGLFTHAGNNDLHVSYIASYNLKTNTWSDLEGGLQGYCNAIAFDSDKQKLYVGGTFTSVGFKSKAVDAHHVVEYDIKNKKWNDMDGGLNNIVHSIFYDDTNKCIYVGGTFTRTFEDNLQLNYIAKYEPEKEKWFCLENHLSDVKKPKIDEENDNVGLNGMCKVMSIDNKSLFIAGSFQIAGNITANSIVRYSLST